MPRLLLRIRFLLQSMRELVCPLQCWLLPSPSVPATAPFDTTGSGRFSKLFFGVDWGLAHFGTGPTRQGSGRLIPYIQCLCLAQGVPLHRLNSCYREAMAFGDLPSTLSPAAFALVCGVFQCVDSSTWQNNESGTGSKSVPLSLLQHTDNQVINS